MVREWSFQLRHTTDIQKPYAAQMEFLSKFLDGSRGAAGDNLGYCGCMAATRDRPCPFGYLMPLRMNGKTKNESTAPQTSELTTIIAPPEDSTAYRASDVLRENSAML